MPGRSTADALLPERSDDTPGGPVRAGDITLLPKLLWVVKGVVGGAGRPVMGHPWFGGELL